LVTERGLPFRVLLVEDHAVVRAGLRLLIEAEDDLTVVGECADGESALEQASSLDPHVIMMDVSMPGMNGLEAARKLLERFPRINILILTMHENEEYFFQALRAGALGYVPKSAPDTEVLAAIRAVAQGKTYIHPSVAHLLVNQYLSSVEGGKIRDNPDGLTDREREVLRLVAMGYTNKEIADKLSISIHTVHNHRTNLMAKLNLHDRLDLLKYALKKGLVRID